jgi:hypothetical protein
MTTDRDYQQRILGYGWDELWLLWGEVQQQNTPNWDLGKAFEYLVLRAFQLEGVEVAYPYSVRLGGQEIEQIDGVLYLRGLACLAECKDWSNGVSIEPIAKMRNQLMRRHSGAIGIVFSRTGFTAPAVVLASYVAPQMILLWNGNELDYALKNRCMEGSLMAKYRYCIEQGNPVFDITPREELELP